MTILSLAKRLPYADHIIVLSKEGTIAEQGSFDVLSSTGGFVASFNLQPPDWNFQLDDARNLKQKPNPKPVPGCSDIEGEANRRTGDMSIYIYYIKSIGWIPVLIFVVFITAFIFCISFPSESI
jgi:ATP-binding cassette subfamily C (CFTR/MRP) protein 1